MDGPGGDYTPGECKAPTLPCDKSTTHPHPTLHPLLTSLPDIILLWDEIDPLHAGHVGGNWFQRVLRTYLLMAANQLGWWKYQREAIFCQIHTGTEAWWWSVHHWQPSWLCNLVLNPKSLLLICWIIHHQTKQKCLWKKPFDLVNMLSHPHIAKNTWWKVVAVFVDTLLQICSVS